MSLLAAAAILLSGVAAGAINVIVGSGTLITFPTLLVFGYSPLVANVSNTVGLVAAGVTGIHGYRAELVGQGATVRRLLPASLVGAVIGAILLLSLPASAFKAVVPVLIAIALVLVLAGPRIQRRTSAREAAGVAPRTSRVALLTIGVLLAGVYGGYFGAAQGVLLIGLMSTLMTETLQQINGVKNVLATVVNAVAAAMFVVFAWHEIDWAVAALIAAGGLIGGVIGARVGRRMSPTALRILIVVIGVVAIVKLVV